MSKIGEDIMAALQEGVAYARGEHVPGLRVHHVEVESVDPRAIRKKLHFTQEQMATFLGASISGYRKWEQGGRPPRILLRVMEREPEAMLRALRA
jgi:putative transcriptional regulator